MSLTLLITTFNRGHLLRTNLERLCELTKPDEVLVIDDGGTDDTHAVCDEFVTRLPIRYVHHDHPGPAICSEARNVGVKLATGDLIVTSEPEMVFVTDVIAQLRVLHAQRGEVISAGAIHHAQMNQPWDQARQGQPTLGWVAPYIAIYERRWLLDVGGWDESFPGPWGWDDTDLLTRLRMWGIGQHIALDIEAVHQWHGLGADPGGQNERHFLDKSFHEPNPDYTDLVANRGEPWGVLRMTNS
jgi:glycosyltransferase involved in cell wall biosynthesis